MYRSDEGISLMKDQPSGCQLFWREKKKVILLALIISVVLIVIITVGVVVSGENEKKAKHPCEEAATRIISAALSNTALSYNRLGYLCNTFGSRFSGTQSLNDALDWMVQEMAQDGLSNPHHEEVWVPTWIRGQEYLHLLTPFSRQLSILGLGGSVNTSSELTAQVIVVNSFADLHNKSNLVKDNIVLYNAPFTTYGATVTYRSIGAIEASKYGAKAALVRSVTPYSLYTPHTGSTNYDPTVTPIPFAAVTVEDAEWMQFMYDSGETITVALYMEGHFLNDTLSSNVMAEVTGSVYPNKVVAIGGHTDSWDVGQGAMDDGGGVLVAWEAVRLLHSLGLTPKRTVRVVGWVNEENGLRGGTAYAAQALLKNETHIFAIESDGGATTPLGLQVTAPQDGIDSLGEIAALLKSIGANNIQAGGGGADVNPLKASGTPVAGLWTDMSKYFWFHHTNADTFDKMDDMQMRKCVATMAVMSYCVADADEDLSRLA